MICTREMETCRQLKMEESPFFLEQEVDDNTQESRTQSTVTFKIDKKKWSRS